MVSEKTQLGYKQLRDFFERGYLDMPDTQFDENDGKLLITSILNDYDIGTMTFIKMNPKTRDKIIVVDGHKRLSIIKNAFFETSGVIPFIDMNTNQIYYKDSTYKAKNVWPLYLLLHTTDFRNYTKEMLGDNCFDYDTMTKEQDKIFGKIDSIICQILDRFSIFSVILIYSISEDIVEKIKANTNIKLK